MILMNHENGKVIASKSQTREIGEISAISFQNQQLCLANSYKKDTVLQTTLKNM